MVGNLTLESLSLGDLPFLLEVRNDKSTNQWLENKQSFSLGQCIEWFTKYKPKWKIILVGNIPVGYLRIHDDIGDSVWIGCDIHPKFRRRGYAKEAYKKQIKIFFGTGYNFIYLRVDSGNAIAISLYGKLGFETESKDGNLETMILKSKK